MRYLAVLLLCVLPLSAPAQTDQEDRDRGFLTGLIEDNLSGVSRSVVIDGFEGALSSRATIASLTIADAEGIWFRAEGLAFEWDRSAVLGGRIEIEEMSARSITLLRTPVSEPRLPDPEAAAFALPELPVAINIDDIRAETITLAEPLLGQEIILTLEGSVSLAGGEGMARIVADRLNGDGRFEIQGSYSNDTRVLDLSLDLAEDEGGLVVRLLDLSGQPSVDLSIEGTGPINDFSADLALATAGEQRLTGQFGLVQRVGETGPNRLDLAFDLGGDLGAMLSDDYAAFFGDDASLSLRVERQEDGTVRLGDLDIDAEALRLQGSATLSPEGWPLQLDLGMQLGFRDGSPVLLPVSGPRTFVMSSDLTVSYDQTAGDSWDGQFEVRGLSRPGLEIPELTLKGDGTIVPRDGDQPGRFSADLGYGANSVAFEDPALTQAIGANVSGQLALSRDGDAPFRIDTFTLAAPGFGISADGSIEGPEAGFATALTARLDVASLTRFAMLTGLEGLQGAAELSLVSEVQPLSGGFDLALSGKTTDLQLGIAPLDPLLGGDGEIVLDADRDETGTRISGLTIDTALTGLTAQASLTSAGSSGNFDLNIRDVGSSLPGLEGPGRLQGTVNQSASGRVAFDAAATLPGTTATVTGSLTQSEDAPVVQADLSAQIADLAPFSVLAGRDLAGSLDIAVQGLIQTDLSLFDVAVDAQATDLSGDIPRLDPLLAGRTTLSGRVLRTDPQSLSFEGISLRSDAVEADISGSFADGVGGTDFGLQLTDIAILDPRLSGGAMLAGSLLRDAEGAWTLDALVTGPGNATANINGTLPPGADASISGNVTASLDDLTPYSQLAGRQLSGAANVSLSGQSRPDLSTFDIEFEAAARELSAGDIALTGGISARGAVTRTARGGTLSLAATGPGGTSLTLDADAVPRDETYEIATDFRFYAENISAYSGLAGRPLSGGVTLEADGSFRADGTRFDLALTGETRDIGVGIAPLATLLQGTGTFRTQASRGPGGGITLQGVRVAYPNLTAAGSLDGRGGSGTGAFNARLADIGLLTPELSGPVTAQGTASRRPDGSWSTQTTATGPGGLQADITGVVEARNLNLQLDGVVPLGLANAYIEPRRLRGEARFDLAVDGPPALSSVSGQITLADARLAAPTLGRALENLQGTIVLRTGQAQLDLRGDTERGGQLGVSGRIGLTGGQVADLVVTAQDIVERDPSLYETMVNARLTVTGPLAGGALIGGTITLGETEIQVPSSDLSTLGSLPTVRHVAEARDVRQTLARAGLAAGGAAAGGAGSNGGGRAYPLDITVEAPAQIFIRGRGLDAELGGRLQLSGTTRQVIPSGQFSLIRGRIDILQQRFALDEGSITLEGNFTPFIRLLATTTARDGTVISIIVEGSAASPEVTFTSTPDLPQDEVLARLIFDQSLNEISPLQAVQLAAAVSELAGRGGAGFINDFRTNLGLDDLDITTDDNGGVAVRAGKYLTENVYTDVTVGSDSTEIQLNLDLSDDVTITGRTSSEGETGLGVFFERDY